MCAIIGWAGTIKNVLLRQLFQNAAPFGPHAVGLAYAEPGNDTPSVFKRAVHPSAFLRNCNHRIERAANFKLGFGHVRYATHGANTDRNAHPFTHGNIVYAHNGMISNYLSLQLGIEVDSECLGPLISEKSLQRAVGSVGLVWFDGAEMFIYRKNQFLMAATWRFADDNFLTIVASRQQIIPSSLLVIPHETHTLGEGDAYRVTSRGIECAWSVPRVEEPRYQWNRCTGQVDDEEEC